MNKKRYRATPTDLEVNVRAIRLLSPSGWKLYDVEELSIGGTVPKSYLAYGDPRKSRTLAYIAKKGKYEEDGLEKLECVTEEIISKIGASLSLKIAASKLARLSKEDVRFLSRNFVMRGQYELFHGADLFARYFNVKTSEFKDAFNLNNRQSERDFYTIDNVLDVLISLFPEQFESLKNDFFRMLAFDAFIGAPDRHATNWGVLEPLDAEPNETDFAPIFDTARGLFWNYPDKRLLDEEKKFGRNRFLERYANNSRPVLNTGHHKGQNHFDLIRLILNDTDNPGRDAIREVFDGVDICSIEHLLQRRFRRIITQCRIRFIRDLLSYRIERIRRENSR